MNFKKLNEKLTKILTEESLNNFKLTDLLYKITYISGKSFEKMIPIVDSLNYNLYDLGTAQIADIVLKNCEDDGLSYKTEDSSYIDYDTETGIIRSIKPIIFTNNEGKIIGEISFKMVLWTHPEKLELL